MSLKSIRNTYSKFLAALAEAGMQINESQKSTLDDFIVALESKVALQKNQAILQTKKIVTEQLTKEFKEVFESIQKHQKENAEKTAKIQRAEDRKQITESMVNSIDGYLNTYVESVLPRQEIVDRARLAKMEHIVGSLKESLLLTDDAIISKEKELTESFKTKRNDLETQIAKLKAELNESMDKNIQLKQEIEAGKAKALLESKVADLPSAEARRLRRRFAKANCEEIERNFSVVSEAVSAEIADEVAEDPAALESEISNILGSDTETEKKPCKKCQDAGKEECDGSCEDEPVTECGDAEAKDDEDLDNNLERAVESKIDADLMKRWISGL